MSKPSFLVLGGVGFIGRNFVTHLVENDLASEIRVVDKALPATSFMNARHKAAFEKVEFKQANLSVPASITASFDKEGGDFDYVINLAGETKYSQSEAIYEERVFNLTVNCAKEAAARKVKKFIDVSTAQVYDAGKSPSDENGKIKPWTAIASYKYKAEQAIKQIPGLNYVILRPAIVYGPADISGLTPRLVVGAVYKQLGDEMKLLWTKDLLMNTVHVDDVCRAILLVCEKAPAGKIYNLADTGATDQEKITSLVCKIFGIKSSYHGSIVSNLAKLNLDSATEEGNEKHLQPWSELCKAEQITSTPLSPYLDKELLSNNALSIDGSLICKELGFSYSHPVVTEELLRDVLRLAIETRLFPKGALSM
ncbi:hypothetical protein H696_02445 [Fonticula alba]|uniref:NAD-dependent epimerase/dehydratase domain-containing protein n=1 Tax=Fonticula alba TaxID=691883 RepID=A0A058ZC35_FONAL|nr:hypothetical protein H696_02445 [Fonticula alba]KCV71501.1 hypothetical protein H696_02445 [Fonticula alba]|eukprot:XP_009494624.1 hypothetical protein H696_02445 [Fonticula alba]